jgi:hypothetical protein
MQQGYPKNPYYSHVAQIPPEAHNLKDYDDVMPNYVPSYLMNPYFGKHVHILGNIVPFTPAFNRKWKDVDHSIMKLYYGKRIRKGCSYNMTHLGSEKVHIPQGCFWVVYDKKTILDKGYINLH